MFEGIKNEQFEGVKENVKDAICVPLKNKEKIIGVINLANKTEGTFNHSDVDLLFNLANQAGIAIENARLFNSLHKTYLNTIKALAAAIEAKDPYTHGHSARVAKYSKQIAGKFALEPKEIQAVESAAYLHDIGKIGIPENILKKVGRLSAEEYALIQTHPEIATKILSPIDFPWEILSLIKEHHESPDGAGYPKGKNGSISLGGKIIAVADAFDAMTSARPYREPLTIEEARYELERNAGKQFDKEVVQTFLHLLRKQLEKKAKSG